MDAKSPSQAPPALRRSVHAPRKRLPTRFLAEPAHLLPHGVHLRGQTSRQKQNEAPPAANREGPAYLRVVPGRYQRPGT